MPGGRGLYAVVTSCFVLSRVFFYLLGVRFGASYDWQHFHDLDLLQNRLWETLLYTHAFTPFMNLLAGAVLKLAPNHELAVYQTLFLAAGGLLANCSAYLLAALGVRRWLIVPVTALLMCSPAFVYFENFLHYEFLAAALLALEGVLFHLALTRGGARYWLLFFLTGALITYVRTSFHLVWLIALVVLALLSRRRQWRIILGSALVPILLVVALYAKNQSLFGFFGTSSWFGFNLAIVTTERLVPTERAQWIRQGKLHPVSGVKLYAGPKAYARFIDLNAKRFGIPVLDRIKRKNGEPNFNHWSYIEVSKLRMQGNRYYLSQRGADYLHTVARGWVDYFGPTTHWHPQDAQRSPHLANRAVLGGWEDLYNTLVHRAPIPPVGLYLPLGTLFLYVFIRTLRSAWKQRDRDCAREPLILFMAFNVVYVPALSCLVTIGELERYRFMVEAFTWVVCLASRGAPAALPAAAPRAAGWAERSASAAGGDGAR
jgi:hypothetical protein